MEKIISYNVIKNTKNLECLYENLKGLQLNILIIVFWHLAGFLDFKGLIKETFISGQFKERMKVRIR